MLNLIQHLIKSMNYQILNEFRVTEKASSGNVGKKFAKIY